MNSAGQFKQAKPLRERPSFTPFFPAFLVGLIAAMPGCRLANADADANLSKDITVAAEYVQRVCESWSADSALQPPPWLSDVLATESELPGRSREVGQRYRWSVGADETTLEVVTARGPDQSANTDNSASVPPPVIYRLQINNPAPQLFLVVSGRCDLRAARMLVYDENGDDNGQAKELVVLDDRLQVLRTEPLNPPVPANQKDATDNTVLPAVRVAMVDSGVNYLLPEIAARLARHPDGSIVGYDYWDLDERPFDAHPAASPFFVQRHGTKTASLMLREAPAAELVPYRYPRPDMSRMQALVKHAADNAVVIVGMPLGGNREEEWLDFADAARQYPEILFVVSAGNNGRDIDQQPLYPARLNIDNMVVVTSADDAIEPAERTNWGRESVDYLLPAEFLLARDFTGDEVPVSGSSYAVSRMVAMLAQLKQQYPHWQAKDFLRETRRRFADGASAKYVKGGYIADPIAAFNPDAHIKVHRKQRWAPSAGSTPATTTQASDVLYYLSPEIIASVEHWTQGEVDAVLQQLELILKQCHISLRDVDIRWLSASEHLLDMGVGTARTLVDTLSPSSPSVFLMRDTRKLYEPGGEVFQYDAEAFGRANTRRRDWLRDSVWVRSGLTDAPLAVAHEIMHVLMNSGEHSTREGNLMHPRTARTNIKLETTQCELAVEAATRHGMLSDH